MSKTRVGVTPQMSAIVPRLTFAFLTTSDISKFGIVNGSYSIHIQLDFCNDNDFFLLKNYTDQVSNRWQHKEKINFSFRRHANTATIGLLSQNHSTHGDPESIVCEIALRACEIIYPFSDKFPRTEGLLTFSPETRDADITNTLNMINCLFTDNDGQPFISLEQQPAPYGARYNWQGDAYYAVIFTALAQQKLGFVPQFLLAARPRLVKLPETMRRNYINGCKNPFVI